MSLPNWVRAECRKVIRRPFPSMAERSSAVKEKALSFGYLHDHVTGEYVYVGPEPEPTEDPRGASYVR